MQQYNKLFITLAGLIVLVGHKYLGLDLSGTESAIVELIIGVLTAAGVYQTPNKPTMVSSPTQP